MSDNKYKEYLKPCKSKYACGNYIYKNSYDECETCKNKDMC